MFAPQPIQIRYDDAGLLGQAAASVGRSQAGMGGLNFAMQQQAQINQSADNSEMMKQNANKLQLAQQMAIQRQQGSTPTNALYSSGSGSPFSQSVMAAKRLTRNTVLGDIKPTDQEAADLDRLQNDPNVGVNDFEKLAGNIGTAHRQQAADQQKQADLTGEMKARSSFVDSAKNQIDPEDAAGIQQLASDPKLSSNELRTAVHQSIQKRQQKDAVQQQQFAKIQVWAQAANALSQEDKDALGPAVNDPKVTTQQLQQAMQVAKSRTAMAAHQQRVMQLGAAKQQLSQAVQNASFDTSRGPEQFTRPDGTVNKAGLAEYQHVQQMQQQINQLASSAVTQTATNPQTGHQIGQTPEGLWVDTQTGQPMNQTYNGPNPDLSGLPKDIQ